MVWRQGMEVVQEFKERNAVPDTTQPMETWSAATAFAATPPITETCYRGHEIRFFRYVRRVAEAVKMDPDIHTWVVETRCNVSEKRSIAGLRILDSVMPWLLKKFIPAVREWHARFFGVSGTLVSLMTCPIISDADTEVFSAVVYGMGLGRMEWLSFDLVGEACKVLEQRRWKPQCTYWKALDEKLKLSSRDSVYFRIAIAPHKMRLTGDELEASAPGAGQRADFLLLAYTSMDSNPSVLGFAYHTTNVVPGTSSNKTTQAYPETRVLWKMNVPLTGLMEAAATSLAETLLLPTPREESKIKDILDEQVWETTVLKQADDSM